jgi:hypothetical protein
MLACLALCVALGLSAVRAADEKAKVSAASLTVFKKLDPKEFIYQPGSTSMGVMVSYPGKYVLSVDESSSVSEFKDDKGTNLGGTGFGAKPRFNTYAMFNKDRSGLVVTAYGQGAPGAGASKVTLKGSLVLVCGADAKTTKEEGMDVKLNEEKKVGDFTVKITFVPVGMFGGPTVTVSGPKNNLKGLVLKDDDGKDVPLSPSGNVFYNPVAKQWNTSFYATKNPKKIKVAVSYFNKDEKITVPVDVTTGLSLE